MMTVGTMGRPYKAIYLMHWDIETTISDNPGPILHNLDDIANFHNRDPETQSLPGRRPKAFVQSGEQWHSMQHDLTKISVTECQSGSRKAYLHLESKSNVISATGLRC